MKKNYLIFVLIFSLFTVFSCKNSEETVININNSSKYEKSLKKRKAALFFIDGTTGETYKDKFYDTYYNLAKDKNYSDIKFFYSHISKPTGGSYSDELKSLVKAVANDMQKIYKNDGFVKEEEGNYSYNIGTSFPVIIYFEKGTPISGLPDCTPDEYMGSSIGGKTEIEFKEDLQTLLADEGYGV